MRLDCVLLADGASQRPDGKFDVYGAGWDTIGSQTFPMNHPRIIVILRGGMDGNEAIAPHKIQIDLIDGDGRSVIPTIEMPVDAEGASRQDHYPFSRVFQLEGVPFTSPGHHDLKVIWDNEVVHSLPLEIVEGSPPLPS